MTNNAFDREAALRIAYDRCPRHDHTAADLRHNARTLLCVAENLKVAARHQKAHPDDYKVFEAAAAIQNARADRADRPSR